MKVARGLCRQSSTTSCDSQKSLNSSFTISERLSQAVPLVLPPCRCRHSTASRSTSNQAGQTTHDLPDGPEEAAASDQRDSEAVTAADSHDDLALSERVDLAQIARGEGKEEDEVIDTFWTSDEPPRVRTPCSCSPQDRSSSSLRNPSLERVSQTDLPSKRLLRKGGQGQGYVPGQDQRRASGSGQGVQRHDSVQSCSSVRSERSWAARRLSQRSRTRAGKARRNDSVDSVLSALSVASRASATSAGKSLVSLAQRAWSATVLFMTTNWQVDFIADANLLMREHSASPSEPQTIDNERLPSQDKDSDNNLIDDCFLPDRAEDVRKVQKKKAKKKPKKAFDRGGKRKEDNFVDKELRAFFTTLDIDPDNLEQHKSSNNNNNSYTNHPIGSPRPAEEAEVDIPMMDDVNPPDYHSATAYVKAARPKPVNPSALRFTGPKSSSIELDTLRHFPPHLGYDDVRFVGSREEPSGRSHAEVGVVLPIVPCAQTALANGGDVSGGGGGGDGDDDEKQTKNDLASTDEKTPLQAHEMTEVRENWSSKMDFLLSVIGYAVDLANVWRFPYLCYKNGGGAFLVPYFSVLMFGAMPVFLMEMSLGQFHRVGPISVWKMSPMFKGIGMASCLMAYIVAFYYNVIIGWSFFYLFSSFSTQALPWTSCTNQWNSPRCWDGDWNNETITPYNTSYSRNTSVSSTLEFFERGVLSVHKSSGLDDLGYMRWQLVLCTLLTFFLLYFCLWKGVKTTGKVVYLTATMPYIILTILLIRGVTLPGAGKGIRYFITPDLKKLADPGVWIDAAIQIFFSVGAGFGTHIAYASYNKFNNNCQRDVLITVIVNSFTSIFSGFVIFSYLGYMSERSQKDIAQVATEGPGLVFNVYPEAIATLPGSNGWSIIFFFMLLTLGIDSAFGGLESPLTGLYDEFHHLMRMKYFREFLTFLIVGSAFLCSLPCLTEGGIYVFTILDTFAAGTSILFTVLCQVVAVSWFYGIEQFGNDMEKMTGSRPSLFWRICWKFVCPILLLIIVTSSIISYTPLAYTTADRTYAFPFYANVLGWCIALSSMLLIPGYAIYKIVRTKGTLKERIAYGISPEWEHEEIRQKKYVRRFHKAHWMSI